MLKSLTKKFRKILRVMIISHNTMELCTQTTLDQNPKFENVPDFFSLTKR